MKSVTDCISICGARTHNLKNISLQIPHDQITVVTGPSGCGKSSLAIDTIFAESQRQFLETVSHYARQFITQLPRPDVDSIEGLLPSLRVDQDIGPAQPRSTVGTITEILDYFRILYSKAGELRCSECGETIRQQTPDEIANWILRLPDQTKLMVLAPLVRGKRRGQHAEALEKVRTERLVRVRVDGQLHDIERIPELDAKRIHHIEAVTDRIMVRSGIESRLRESLDLALRLSGGTVIISCPDATVEPGWSDRFFSTRYSCPACEKSFDEPEPRVFSFNSPYGACPDCDGLGKAHALDLELVIPDRRRTLRGGAICPWSDLGEPQLSRKLVQLREVMAAGDISMDLPVNNWTKQQLDLFWNGSSRPKVIGLKTILDHDSQNTKQSDYLERLNGSRREAICGRCNGSRLGDIARSVFWRGKTIIQISSWSLGEVLQFVSADESSPGELSEVLIPVLSEIRSRLAYLCRVGLDYLSLIRPVDSLSGGEHQRARLASSIGAGLTNVCFVLDEPSRGLHARDSQKLVELLGDLRDAGNTLLVVEHDESIMRAADLLVDLGPGAGSGGGALVDQGTPEDVAERALGLTGKYLAMSQSGKSSPPLRAFESSDKLSIVEAKANNLDGVQVDIPLGGLICVTGVSGSGKSTLVHDVLIPLIRQRLGWPVDENLIRGRLEGGLSIRRLVSITQRPFGRTPRGCPATYCGALDEFRKVFAATKLAKQLGFGPQRFSFNSAAGWCPDCRGQGFRKVEMKFLPDLYTTCSTCRGQRYNLQTLQVKYRDRSIADVLGMSVSEALQEFVNIPSIVQKLEPLEAVGVGYLQLGQPSTTLSGGEAQRIRLASELTLGSEGPGLYVLDEPTTGLHFADVEKLTQVLRRLVTLGHSVLVIEHQLDVIASSDWVIDLGPEGGQKGGKVVAVGTPAQIAHCQASYTGRFLARILGAE